VRAFESSWLLHTDPPDHARQGREGTFLTGVSTTVPGRRLTTQYPATVGRGRSSGLARETVRKYLGAAERLGLRANGPPPSQEQIVWLVQAGRAATRQPSSARRS
jgi:hypothetical protein